MADITLRIKYEYDLEDNGFLGIFTATKDYFLTEDRQSVADVVREICEVLKHKTFYITIDALTKLRRCENVSNITNSTKSQHCKLQNLFELFWKYEILLFRFPGLQKYYRAVW